MQLRTLNTKVGQTRRKYVYDLKIGEHFRKGIN